MYVIIWEFIVKSGREDEFEQAYGAGGLWVQFFRRDEHYLGTELINDIVEPQRYLTIDRWTSESTYRDFRERNLSEYELLDRQCEHLMDSETPLGAFSVV